MQFIVATSKTHMPKLFAERINKVSIEYLWTVLKSGLYLNELQSAKESGQIHSQHLVKY